MKNKNIQINRRTFLKSGTASTIVGLGMGTVSGQENSDQIRFIEAGVLHNITDESVLKNANKDTVCNPPKYDIFPESTTLRVDSRRVTEQERELLNEESTIIYSREFNGSPTSVSGLKHYMVVSELTPRLQPQLVIRVDEPYQEPEVRVEADDEFVVRTSKSTESLRPGEELQHVFPERDIVAKMERTTGELVAKEESMKEWHRAVDTEKWTEKVRVRPEVFIRNYGLMTIKYI